MEKLKLIDIVIDPSIQVRTVNPRIVNKYAMAIQNGAKFPPLLIEEKTNRCICGNHRYNAYKKVYDPDFEVNVKFKKYKKESEIIKDAAKDNAVHGEPLTTWDKKCITLRLKKYGESEKSIADLLSVSVERVEQWGGMTVMVVGNGTVNGDGKPVPIEKPVKHGAEHLVGTTVNNKDYENHEQKDLGIPIKNIAAMITRHILAGWINTDDKKTMESLKALYDALSVFRMS